MTTATMSEFAQTIVRNKYAMDKPGGGKETWAETANRVAASVTKAYLPSITEKTNKLVESRKFLPGGRYLYAAGRRFPQINNCFLAKAEDSRESWAEIVSMATNVLMTGGGIGVVYSNLRPEGARVGGLGGSSTGPLSLMQMVNECGRFIMQGGSRRSAIWAGLHWNHPDVFKFIALKDWSEVVTTAKRQDFNFPAPMDGTNISIILDDTFFDKYAAGDTHAIAVYDAAVSHMLRTGEPGFSIDIGENEGENLRNPCCEVVSRDHNDICNLGSINLAAIDSIEEFAEVVHIATGFLICGTLYSKLPIEGMYKTREKTRRLGLGLMGLHEWLLKRGKQYGPDKELETWLEVYANSGAVAHYWADKLSISRPVATRAIAPNGTISIVAETTSGIEPIFAPALKRRYLVGKAWKYQYIVDATARRIIEANNVDPELIEDAYVLAQNPARRLRFQSWVQRYVDQGISSTINIPAYHGGNGYEGHFKAALMKELPSLRGITVYPDGARGGQPLVRCAYKEAIDQLGTEFSEESEIGNEFACRNGVCGA